ncbi:MAG: hypothetical protein Kow0092_35470 [Deferrisomatales bacterium]
MRKRFVTPLVIAAALACAAVGARAEEPQLEPAPTLELITVEGEPFTVPQEGLVVLAFANTSCSACKQELKVLKQVKEDLADKLEVVVFYADVNVERVLKPFVERAKFPFKSVSDPEFQYADRFGFAFTPATVIIKDGKIVEKKSGWRLGKDEAPFTAKLKGLV